MNNDLISRSALKETMFQNEPVERFHPQENKMWQECFGFIENAPAVDAVEVVRCKDCRHWHRKTGWCNHHSHFLTPEGAACHPWESADWKMFGENDFCSYGERKQGDTNE